MLYVMCGISGSGKSSFARTLSDNVVSTDSIRRELFGDESVQSNPKQVFALAYARIQNAINSDTDVVFDAMNLHSKDRKRLVAIAQGNCTLYVFDTLLDECKSRQTKRDRQVPVNVIERQYNTFKSITDNLLLTEGWKNVYRVSTHDSQYVIREVGTLC